jgi:hypothetical protein
MVRIFQITVLALVMIGSVSAPGAAVANSDYWTGYWAWNDRPYRTYPKPFARSDRRFAYPNYFGGYGAAIYTGSSAYVSRHYRPRIDSRRYYDPAR